VIALQMAQFTGFCLLAVYAMILSCCEAAAARCHVCATCFVWNTPCYAYIMIPSHYMAAAAAAAAARWRFLTPSGLHHHVRSSAKLDATAGAAATEAKPCKQVSV
jgi:hypothetical protein